MLRKNQIKNLFDNLGEFTKRKDWYNFRCPFHHGESFKFGINLHSGWYTCFVCGVGGSLDSLFQKFKEGTLLTIGSTSPLLSRDIPPEYEEDTSSGLLKRLNEGGLDQSEESTQFKHLNKLTPDYFRRSFRYLQDIPDSRDSVGERHALKYLQDRGIDNADKIAGIMDEYSGRIIFPFVKDDIIVYFQARSFINIPLKTLNPDEENGWTVKSNVLWRYDEIRKHKSDIVCLTEGIFDAYSVWKYIGIPATPLLGKTISWEQIKLLHQMGINEIIVFLDADAMLEAVKLAVLLYNKKFHVRLVTWKMGIVSPYKDPNNIDTRQLQKLILESIEITPASEILLPLEYV